MPLSLFIVLSGLLLVANVVLAAHVIRYRAERKQRHMAGPWRIPTKLLDELAPEFRVEEFGPTRGGEVVFVGRGSLIVPGGTTDAEAWVLAALAKRARLMFEFGTCTGKTTYLWARNSTSDARIVTLTLRPEDQAAYDGAAGDSEHDATMALAESQFDRFMYTGTDVEPKVHQLYGDSKQLDISPWKHQCDLVFVDGSHAYSYVLSDSRKALELVRPGGLVIWHDYAGPRHCPEVYRGLNELARDLPLFHVHGTTFVAYQTPA